ncbi:MAG: hypothetical protein P1U47_14795 [Zhongshania sp.]|nr:hypothetical protein [Zhongshania sp.]MDF1693646.1 hypothetical protein [Zhongshania sp.]
MKKSKYGAFGVVAGSVAPAVGTGTFLGWAILAAAYYRKYSGS